jgi:hypothetical protein
MVEKVWGPADIEMKELSDLESDLKVFFAKHKEVLLSTLVLDDFLNFRLNPLCVSIEM